MSNPDWRIQGDGACYVPSCSPFESKHAWRAKLIKTILSFIHRPDVWFFVLLWFIMTIHVSTVNKIGLVHENEHFRFFCELTYIMEKSSSNAFVSCTLVGNRWYIGERIPLYN